MQELVNKMAPDFELKDQNGKAHKLSSYRGQKVLLYFYPKDMTPGCTMEAKAFRDAEADLKKLKIVVLGVSVDDVDRHKKFEEKHCLNFTLLSDVEKEVVNLYGVWMEKSMFGKKYMGIRRDSFLIDEKGKVVKHYVKVSPTKHVPEVIADVEGL